MFTLKWLCGSSPNCAGGSLATNMRMVSVLPMDGLRLQSRHLQQQQPLGRLQMTCLKRARSAYMVVAVVLLADVVSIYQMFMQPSLARRRLRLLI